KLRAAYVDSPPGLDGLNSLEFKDLIWSLRVLGDTEVAIMVVDWMEKSTAWQSWGEWELDQLVYVLSDSGIAGKSARDRLAKHISSKYLADGAAARSVPTMVWKHFARWLRKDLPAESRVQWAGKIKAAFADRIGEMQSQEFQYLTQALVYLDVTQAAPVAIAWLSKDGKLSSASTFDLAYIAAAARADRAAMAPLMNQLEELWLARNNQKPLKLTESAPIVWTWLYMGSKAKAKQWTMRAYESMDQVGTSDDAESMVRLGHMFLLSGLTGKNKGYPAFAASLARLANQGKLTPDNDRQWRYKFCAAPLGTLETQQILKAALTDEQGNPRAMVANILAWTYRNAGELNAWREFLDQKVAATVGDGKALWLMAKAYTESIVPKKVDMRRSFRWLNAALATAATQPVRLVVLTELVGCYESINRHKIALSILESVKDQYTGEERAKVDALEQRVRGRLVARLKDIEAEKAAGELVRKKAKLTYYRKCLAAARTGGDQDSIAKLEAAIARLEAELGQ
ncbi:MAG: hypothetical protein SVV80_14415, partial [Planctomycetota bacterium]|nr:hypothetical protein [Planctomycetota bacterium]